MGDIIELRPKTPTPVPKPSHGAATGFKKRFKRFVQTALRLCYFNYRVSTTMGVVRLKSTRMTPKVYMNMLLQLRSRFPGPYRRNAKEKR